METLVENADQLLVKRAMSGDREAFEELVRKTARSVYARLYLAVGDSHRAEDLTQETFLIAYKSMAQLQEPTKFHAWIFSIAQRLSMNSYRHASRKKRGGSFRCSDELESLQSDQGGPIEELKRKEAREKVLATLRSMPEDYRVPLMLRYLSGANYDTISRQLGMSNGSLRGLLNRGMNLLRSEMKRFSQEV